MDVNIPLFVFEGRSLRSPQPETVTVPSDAHFLKLLVAVSKVVGQPDTSRCLIFKPKDAIFATYGPYLQSLFVVHDYDPYSFCDYITKHMCHNDSVEGGIGIKPSQPFDTTRALVVKIVPPFDFKKLRHEEDEDGSILNDMMKRLRRLKAKDPGTPSENCRLSQFLEIQRGADAIIDGRRTSVAVNPLPPPLDIFHPVFAAFRRLCQDRSLSVPEDFVRTTAELMYVGARIFPDVWELEEAVRPLLSALLGFPLQRPSNKSITRSNPGYFIPSTVPPPFSGTAALATIELDEEFGTAALRSTFAYIAHWCDIDQRANDPQQLLCALLRDRRRRSAHLHLGRHDLAMITGKPVVQRLKDIRLSQDHHLDGDVLLENARVLYSLKVALERLHTFYTHLPLPEDMSRFFPLATQYITGDDRVVTFTYVDVLKDPGEGSTVFLARLDEPGPRTVVVKFVERYGTRAHELLAEARLAPALLYHGPVWPGEDELQCRGHEMVVMEYVEGIPAFEPEQQRAAAPEVGRALRVLHDNGMVHGDLRPTNILLLLGWWQGVEGRVIIIDFDWAGREGEVRYPCQLSKHVFPVDGIDDYAPIVHAHDKGMLSLLYEGVQEP
ncbi:uncharacterized protein BXZ73DRAFT_95469 [Epithele typhae]|uniref:uncharacterized protein n=1 Tax=Epithele typhae TaxID=378194 RepID=UPI002007A5E9|nr:uncharacterized protein BXZ73DRAFT_95469 [Epithele typhae]KAH9945950.1 hypothetical protein BXZ73DRAFT_95469 [Epithele typhae]